MENYLDCQLPIADECNIEIDKEPLHVFRNNTSEEIPDKLAIYNATDGNYLSTLSKRSAENLRTYGEFAKMLSDGIFSGSSILNPEDVKVTDKLWNRGARYSRIMEFPKAYFNFNNDKYHLVLWSWTSYDVNWAEQFIFAPMCIQCLNGMFHADWKIKGLSKKNWNNKASIDAVDIVNAISAFEKYPEELEQMASSMIPEWQVKALFENTIAKIKDPIHSRVSEYRMRQLSNLWDGYKRKYGLNLYAVYQTVTDWASKPEGKGMKMNMIRTRSGQVSDMINSPDWNALINNKALAEVKQFATA